MLFKKEFDIDKEFFTERPIPLAKRKVALRVFIVVSVLTFLLLCLSALMPGFNLKFGSNIENKEQPGLKAAQEYFFDALKYYEGGEQDKAIEALNKQIQILNDPDAYNYLAKIYLEKGEAGLAIENFKKAIEYKPDFFEPNYELGKIYFSINDYKNAAKYLTAASSVQIDNTELLGMTAEAYKMTGRADEAIVLFEKILELEPDNCFANAKIAEVYFQRLQYRKAIPYFEEALSVSFEENVALQLAKSYMEIGSLNSALEVAKEILAEDPENKQAKSLKFALEYKKGLTAENVKKEEAKDEKPEENKEPLDLNLVNNYVKQIENPIKANWTPPVGSNLKKASVKFSVDKQGELVSNIVFSSSGMVDFDKSALEAIELSKPFPPLPDGLGRDVLDIIFTFDFNVK